MIVRRLQRLSESCAQTLVVASVLGREFDFLELERAGGLGRDEILDIVDEAAQERVVTDVPGVAGRLRFAHALIRDTLYDGLTSGRRARLERRVGEALEELYAAELGPHVAELAHHFLAAVPAGTVDKAIEYGRRAGEWAVELTAFEEAQRLFASALEVAADEPVRCELLLALGDAQARAGDTPASKATFRKAADLAESLGLPVQLARAALGYGGRIVWDASRTDPQLVPLLERAIEAIGEEPSALRAKLLARLSGGPLRDSAANAERRRSLASQAVQLARRLDDPRTLSYALLGYISSHHAPDFTPEQVEIARELIELSLETGDVERAVDGYQSSFEAAVELGDLRLAQADLEAMNALAEKLRQPAQRWIVSGYQALLALLQGRFDTAERLIEDAHAIGRIAQGPTAASAYHLQLYLLRREQGRLHEVEQLVRRAADKNPTYPIWRCALTNILGELGLAEDARDELNRLAANRFATVPWDEEWCVSLSFLAETTAALGENTHARTLYELLLPYGDRLTISYSEISLGPVARFLGLLASTTAHSNLAEQHFEDAADLCRRVGARPWLAHTKEDHGTMLLTRRRSSDTKKGHGLIDEATALYRECGLDHRAAKAAGLRQ